MPDFPELSVDMLAELVATELREWPSDSWLFVDDYHHLSDSRASERFLQVLIREAPITCLIATRRRPAWATARLLMHGDVAEIGRTELAMTKKEAAALLASRQEEDAARILDVADGWPAVLGLAARSPALGPPDTADLPTSVYEYVAEEVYNNFTLPTRRGLCLLTIGAYVTEELAATLLGSEARTVVSSAADAGVLSAEPSGTIDMHPLVVTFLRSKLLRFPKDGLATPIDKVVGYYLEHSRWDDAFDVVARLGDAGLFASVLEGAMDDLLSKGRHATLARWLAFAQREGFDLPVTDLARAEVALRTGELGEAEAFATRAAQRFGTGHPRCSQALLRAGQAAHLADRYEQAVAHHRSARQTAATPSASSSATWGEFVASAQLESQNLSELLNAVIELDDGSADSMIQIANGRYMLACRIGGLREAIEGAIRVRAALAQASDPMTRSSYRNCLGRAYALMARYREAAAVASEQLEEAEAYRMRFIRPNALCTLAIAQMGLRQFGAARATLAVAFAEAEERKDLHNLIDLAAVETRLHVSAGRTDPRPVFPDKAWGRFPGRAVYAEFLASQGLLHTYLDELDRAQDLAEQALRLSDSIEPLGLAHGVQAVVAAKQGRGAAETERALSTARRTGKSRCLHRDLSRLPAPPQSRELKRIDCLYAADPGAGVGS
jgi:tetratricopeptide (TPR) repeat protein